MSEFLFRLMIDFGNIVNLNKFNFDRENAQANVQHYCENDFILTVFGNKNNLTTISTIINYISSHNPVLRLLLHESQVGVLIGVNGSNISQIREKYEIKIYISNKYTNNSLERIVLMSGSPTKLKDCFFHVISTTLQCSNQSIFAEHYSTLISYIKSSFIDDQSHTSGNSINDPAGFYAKMNEYSLDFTAYKSYEMKCFHINNNIIGTIIGVKGSTISSIRKLTNANIKISASDKYCDFRKIIVSGSSKSVYDAIALMKNSITRNIDNILLQNII
ncbi:hypothetical protein A3Q56_03052 [Intoshia linei]|uniref:K Homology domain-containing protein n=1 Tax=Intoshia linei TaxID=1819745 RepID=A0A177B4J3_9BILA|nr:hypothetical protein A3Q56_03052 [Intoshia linei]